MSRLDTKLKTTGQTKTDEQSCRFAITSAQNTTETCNMSLSENDRISVYVMKTLNAMRENGEYCDLVFELNNSKFSAHRLVMAVWSPLMKNLLQFQSACIQRVRVTYDKPEVFQIFITFLYTGVLPEKETNFQAVLLLAATFQIHLLTELCKEHLKTGTTVDNVISMYHLSIKFQLTELEVHCVKFLCQHMTEIAQKQEFQDLTPTQIHFFLGSESMSKLDPEIKLFLIISWLAEDVPNREQFLVLLLRHIDWSVVAKEFLVDIIQTENFFTSNPSSLYLLLQTLHSSSFSLGPYESHFRSLQQQYHYLLSNAVNSNVVLDSGKLKHFQPLNVSLISSPTEEQSVSDHAAKVGGIKSELLQNSDEIETSMHHVTACSDVTEKHMSTSSNILVATLNTSSKGVSVSKTSSQTLCSQITEMSVSMEGTSISKVPLTLAEGSMRRKRLRPQKIITDSKITKNRIVKLHQNKKKKNLNQHNTRGQLKSNVNELNLDYIESLNENLQTKDGTKGLKQCNVFVEQKMAVVKKENIKNRKSRKQVSASVKKTVKKITSDGGNCEQQLNQSLDVKDLTKREQRGKKITHVTSMKTDRAKNAGNKQSSLRKNLIKVNPKKETRMKKDNKLATQKCSECEFTTSNHIMLKKHQTQVHEGNCLFCCSLCSFKSKWSKEYYDHMKQSHFPGPPFHCDEVQCEYNTEKFQELMLHRKQHNDQRPFVCDICLTAFRSKNNLYQHFKIHSDEKKFECLECGRCFKLKNTLEQHMVTHSDLRPYLCDLCGFSTKFQSHLISHKRIHTGDVHHCSFPSCTYSTPKKSQLKSHMRSHLGIRRHVCSKCGKAFVEKSHLIRHERTHSSERAYVCKECSYSSTRADKLREHIQKHHSEEALRAKATVSASKKLDAAGKGRVKKVSKTSSQYKDGVDMLVSHSDSLIEVVVMKNTAKYPRLSNCAVVETVLPNILTTSDVSTTLVKVLPFQPLVSQEGDTLEGASLSMEPLVENVLNSEFNGTGENEKEKSTVEVIARRALPLEGPSTVRDIGFEYQIKASTGGATARRMASGSSLGDSTIMACSSTAGNKGVIAGKNISQRYQQNTGLTVPPYSLAADTSSHFSKSSTQFEQPVSIPQQNPHGYHLITFADTMSSTATQQYYHYQDHDQRHGEQQQHHQDMQQSTHFSSAGNYLY